MTELFLEGQESKTVPYCHDRPPQYDSCQPSQDILTSVIENDHTRRILLQRLNNLKKKSKNLVKKKKPAENDYLLLAETTQEGSRIFTEGMQIATELSNIYKERAVQNTELYTAMSRLTTSEFNRTYASLKRNPNLRSHDTANVSKTTDDAPAKPPMSFWKRIWKRIWKHSARP
jgi:hypothetical protein